MPMFCTSEGAPLPGEGRGSEFESADPLLRRLSERMECLDEDEAPESFLLEKAARPPPLVILLPGMLQS
jgi:hypothetical protein